MQPTIKELKEYLTKKLYLRELKGSVAVPKAANAHGSASFRVSIATGTTSDANVIGFLDDVAVGLSITGAPTGVAARLTMPTLVTLQNGRFDFDVAVSGTAAVTAGTVTVAIGAPVTATNALVLADGRSLDSITTTMVFS